MNPITCITPYSTYTIEWDWHIYTLGLPGANDQPGRMDMHYSINGGSTWFYIGRTEAGSYSYEWIVPSEVSTQVSLRISDIDHPGLIDTVSWSTSCNAYLESDWDDNCYVNFFDYGIIAQFWLEDPGTNFDNLTQLSDEWLICTHPCDEDCD